MNNIECVYIYKNDNGEFPNINFNIMENGCNLRMIPIKYFNYKDIDSLDINKYTPVFAGSPIIHKILNNNNIKINNIEIPKGMDSFLGRDIETINIKQAKELYKQGEHFFIKPLENHKLFTGFILNNDKDYSILIGLEDNILLLKSEIITIKSEYRCYINNHKIIGCYNYNGDSTIFPDMDFINESLQSLISNNSNDYLFPISYSLDYGINDKGETFFIEANDSISLGNYGLSPFKYSGMIIDRWKQLFN